MKITLIGPVYPYRGGISHFTTMLAKKLIAAGHEVQVISFKKQYPAWLYPGESDKDYSPSRERVDAEYLLTPLNPISWHKTSKAIAEFKPHQVIVPWWVTFWGPAFHHIISRLKRQNIPITILIHNTMPHEARPWDRFLARRTLQGGDSFIVMTDKEKNRLLSLMPGTKRINIAPLPICQVFKDPILSKSEIRNQLKLPEDQVVILHFGFIRPYKGLNVLLDAFKMLIEHGAKMHLLIVGEFWEDKMHYLSQIKSLGIGDRIHIYDSYIPDDKVADYFTASDIFAAPYIGGTQSAALKTALSFGLPSVATDAITDAFLVSHPERCLIVPVNNPSALAVGIEKQIKLPIQRPEEIESLVNQSWKDMLAVIDNHQCL